MGKAYLACSPTQLPNGSYHWEVPLLPPAELPLPPEGLLARLLPEPPPPPPEYQPVNFRGLRGDRLTRRLEGLLRWACERVATTPEGQRHNTLLSYARLIGGYVHLGLDPEQATRALTAAGVQAGLPHPEAEATARDGLKYGLSAPLELPADGGGRVSAGQKSTPEVRPEEVWPEPEPLDTAAKLKPWPTGTLLPPDIEDFGLVFAERLCVDPGPVLVAMLAALTAVTNGRLWIEPDRDNPTWREPTALWLAVVMGVSTGKTPILKTALQPAWEIEKELRKEHEEEMTKYEAELARWEAAKRSERGPKPKRPTPKRLLAQDATREALADLLGNNPGILAYHDELKGLFAEWNREDKKQDRAFYLASYSATPTPVDRVVRGSMFVEKPVLSLLGFIQYGPFRERVLEAQSGDGNGADGLLQRFIVVTAHERPWQDDRPAIEAEVCTRYHNLVTRVWDILRVGGERTLHLDPEAQALWYQWENSTQREMRNPDQPEAWKALLGKRMGLTARLAAVLAAAWEEYGPVSATTLKRAIALVRWLEPHARRIWHRALSGNDEPIVKLARKLQSGMLEVAGKRLEVFTERDITRNQVGGIALVGEARRVLAALVEAGWLIQDGKTYRINPRVKEVGSV
ncbi:hypothetical protein Mlute_02836 [Meiothermus luteus]|uniref:DUF3987 domain-containing protein n=2 Tax=Meiothermus luteus TaxID=2026184 RepID=A0A399EGE4_9DEIN|nr:hypothetical protein Mlute_02836 [Meiothermus luteus]